MARKLWEGGVFRPHPDPSFVFSLFLSPVGADLYQGSGVVQKLSGSDPQGKQACLSNPSLYPLHAH